MSSDITAVRHIDQLDLAKVDNFINQLINCKGHLYISGIGEWATNIMLTNHVLFVCPGKSGAVSMRLAASLSSVGVAATFVHAAEWGHGDLGEHSTSMIVSQCL